MVRVVFMFNSFFFGIGIKKCRIQNEKLLDPDPGSMINIPDPLL
jgi:hypothetical protein